MTNVLFIGDIVGGAARKAVAQLLPQLRQEFKLDCIIANGENAANGFGLTKAVYDELIYDFGIDILTGGNHIWDKKEIFKDIEHMDHLVRPLNYPNCTYGAGFRISERANGVKIGVINLLGRVFVQSTLDCPFRTIDALLATKPACDIVIVDMHAETTSEKKALGFYLDGRVSAVLGTHTHVATNDARILDKKTAYQTDVGMVGAANSVLGMRTKAAQERFLSGLKEKFDVEEQNPIEFNATLIEFNTEHTATKITPIIREVRI